MPPRSVVPDALLRGPFASSTALAAGVTHRQLAGPSYVRVLPGVWVAATHLMSEADWFDAALAYGPPDARLTGFTRIQHLGLDVGPRRPLQLVVGRDLHREERQVVVRRTRRMPEHDEQGVSATAAFVELCRWATVSDAVVAGDWLAAQGLVSRESLVHVVRRDHWREGAPEARWVWPLVDGRARSPQESRGRLAFHAAQLPPPEVNVTIEDRGRVLGLADWWWRRYRLAAEYEGGHHQTDRAQYLADIDRYRRYRTSDVAYLQITSELAARPRTMVSVVHQHLVAAGYGGPPPDLGDRFSAMASTVRAARAWVPDLPAPVHQR